MKRFLLPIFILIFFQLTLFASKSAVSSPVSLRTYFSTPADNGSYTSIFSNPASLPFRESDGKDFLILFRYKDSYSKSLFNSNFPYRFMPATSSDVVLSFSGRSMAFTALFENNIDRSSYSKQSTQADLYSVTHFELDMGYNLSRFSAGIRISGGNQLKRSDKQILNLVDYLRNSFLTKFESFEGGEYFTLGVGALYRDDYFSFGFYSDHIIYLNDAGSATSSLTEFLSSLSIGAKAIAPRFTSDGELLFVRPAFSLLFDNIYSTESRFSALLSLTMQLLPESDLIFSLGYSNLRDAQKNGFFTIDSRYALFSLEFSMGSYSALLTSSIPVDGNKGVDVDLIFRIKI